MGRRSLNNRRILLTGASSGIGRALAIQLAPFKTKLALVARRQSALSELANELDQLGAGEVLSFVGDVTDASLRSSIIERLQQDWGGLDVLVNNAGISAHNRFEHSSADVLRKIMDVNFFSAAELTRVSISLLKQGSDSLVVNVGSILGHRGIPYNSEYCGSKFALRGWSEAIRPELSSDGISLMLVSPGTTQTEFFEHLIVKDQSLPWAEQKGLPPEQVAAQIIRGIQRRRYEIYPNWRGRVLVLLTRMAPWLLDRIMNRYG